MTVSEQTLFRARKLVAERLGLEFTEQRRDELERGLLSACRTSGAAPDQYLARLGALPDDDPEWRRLAARLTIGETYFFRDQGCFAALEGEVLPALIAARRAEGILRLRLWSAGCASGEEPYSLAIVLDRVLQDRADWQVTILATDISGDALDSARRGVYRRWSLRDTPPWLRDRYFRRNGENFELDSAIRRMVTFAPLNLAKASYPALATNTVAMDVVLCRNVLMYFTPATQRAVVGRLQAALAPGGWLVVAPVEASAELLAPLVPVRLGQAIFYAKSAITAPPAPAPRKAPAIVPATPRQPARAEQTGRPPQPPREAPPEPVSESAEPVAEPAERVPESAEPVGEPAEPVAESTVLCERARRAADAGRLEQAGALCRAALAQDKLNAHAHLLLAEICQEQDELDAALTELRAAIYLAPDSAPAHFLLGSLLLRRGEPSTGRRSLETALTLLSAVPPHQPLPDERGLVAGELMETVRAYLELA